MRIGRYFPNLRQQAKFPVFTQHWRALLECRRKSFFRSGKLERATQAVIGALVAYNVLLVFMTSPVNQRRPL